MNPVNELPRYAVAYFQHVSGAVSATNCLHNSILHGTKLSISYKPFLKTSRWREWFSSNSRVFLPFLFSLVAALTYAIFDPVRVFFIVNRITGRFDFGHSQRWSAWNSDIEVGEEAGADAELSGSGGASNKGGSVAHAAGLESTAGESTPSSDWLESVKNLGKGMYRTLSRFIISDDEHGLPIWSKESYEKLKRILGVNPFDDVVLLAGASVSTEGKGVGVARGRMSTHSCHVNTSLSLFF